MEEEGRSQGHASQGWEQGGARQWLTSGRVFVTECPVKPLWTSRRRGWDLGLFPAACPHHLARGSSPLGEGLCSGNSHWDSMMGRGGSIPLPSRPQAPRGNTKPRRVSDFGL